MRRGAACGLTGQESWVKGPALEIWITNKIDQDAVSWRKLLRSISIFNVDGLAGSFFIDEESCCDCRSRQWWTRTEILYNQRANIIGHDEYFKSVNMGEALNHRNTQQIWICAPGILVPICVPLCSKLSATASATVNMKIRR
ncbi:hypothetical protein F2Q69_00038520 [Brassica cretica]|uniref:F-box associated beta-propeller type 1 domain-containing protein n=1 Tax=Brassica cretica TaxID=69181 RepID=A0A8S9SL36_BRACR|nr:hypothetical protein F2Q69_00038520 [Brassica cretica]